jgi:hypothetical protein
MALPNIRVEVGFDLSDQPSESFFRLDDETRGRLDNTTYVLGGPQFYDVTDHVSAISITRGKEPIDTNYPPGECEVQFNNHNRWFDPLYPDSPFNGNIVPRREVRVFGNDIEIYRGWIDDWDLNYQKDGDSITIAKAYDALQLFNNRYVSPHTPALESTGSRINSILDRTEINWPFSQRAIDNGQVNVAANEITEPVPALDYLQNISGSDPGDIYIARDGKFTFIDRSKAATSADFVEFSGTAISFDNLNVSYGAELLFNEITLTRQNGGTVTVIDSASTDQYGIRAWNITDSQVATDAELEEIGLGLISLYSLPQYRFSALDVYLHKFSPTDQDKVLNLDFGDVCKVVFTPNNIGDPIERYVEVINIEQRIDPEQHVVTLGFSEILFAPLVLDDLVFGKLDEGVLSW